MYHITRKLFQIFDDLEAAENNTESLKEICVLQPTEFGGITPKDCELVDNNEDPYLKVRNEYYDPETDTLPSIDNWPAAAKTSEEYYDRVRQYKGGSLKHDASFISNLLSSVELNIPHKNYTDSKGRPIMEQVALDICRIGQLYINGKLIFDIKVQTTNDETKKVINLFNTCLSALNDNYALTTNVLKLVTQATVAHLSTSIVHRFNNGNLGLRIKSFQQKIFINISTFGITNIRFNTTWGILPYEAKDSEANLFMKGIVEIFLRTHLLTRGSAGNGRGYEKCSAFYPSLEEVEAVNLLTVPDDWGHSLSDCLDEISYDSALEKYNGVQEAIHPLCVKEIVKDHDLYNSVEVQKRPRYFLSSPYLKDIYINNQKCYSQTENENETDVYFQKAYLRIAEIFEDSFSFTNDLLCTSNISMIKYLRAHIHKKFVNQDSNRMPYLKNYTVYLEYEKTGLIKIQIDSDWEIQRGLRQDDALKKNITAVIVGPSKEFPNSGLNFKGAQLFSTNG